MSTKTPTIGQMSCKNYKNFKKRSMYLLCNEEQLPLFSTQSDTTDIWDLVTIFLKLASLETYLTKIFRKNKLHSSLFISVSKHLFEASTFSTKRRQTLTRLNGAFLSENLVWMRRLMAAHHHDCNSCVALSPLYQSPLQTWNKWHLKSQF